MKNKYFSLILSAATLTLSSTAFAGSNDLMTVGLGATYSLTRTQDLSESESSDALSPSLNVRLKLLRIFGAEFSYAPTVVQNNGDELVMDATFRASALLFVLPTEYVGVYGKAGMGTYNLSEMVNPMGEGNSFHAGGGMDIHIGDNFAVGGEFLILIPGAHSIDTALSKHGLRSSNENLGSGLGTTERSPVEVQMSDLITSDNFQASVSLRYYF